MGKVTELKNYIMGTDTYNEKTEKFICWIDQAPLSTITKENFEEWCEIPNEKQNADAIEHSICRDTLRSDFFANDEDYNDFIDFCEKATYISMKSEWEK